MKRESPTNKPHKTVTMKKAIRTEHEIKAPIDKVWALIRTGEQWEEWVPILSGSKVENNNRYCEVAGSDDVLEERFLSSDAEKTFIYAIDKQQTFPATDITAIIRLEAQGPITKMYWTAEMQPFNEEAAAGLEQQVPEVYAASAGLLETLANKD